MRYTYSFLIVVIIFLVAGCANQDENSLDSSFELGVITSFAEVVAADVKQLALSSPMTPGEADQIEIQILEIAERFGIEVLREESLIQTELFPKDIAEGKIVFLMGKEEALSRYNRLKQDINNAVSTGKYEEKKMELSRSFGRLLSYSTSKINDLLSANTSYRNLTHFGVKATNVFFYYKDLPKAIDFYENVLGLERVANYDNASTFRVSSSTYMILVDETKGMHSSDEPKSVAIALITDQLEDWYNHLQANDVKIRYSLKVKEGGPHDGFVAIDPEGYLLEFETFKHHRENEKFMPYLDQNEPIKTSSELIKTDLEIKSAVTWLYYKDILAMEQFYQEILGFELVADQGWAKIYRVTDDGFIGLVDEKRGMNTYSDQKGMSLSFFLEDVEGWFKYLNESKSMPLKEPKLHSDNETRYKAFVAFDPEKYFIEFDQFYPHPDNDKLIRYVYND